MSTSPPKVAPYGSWPSPITSSLIAEESIGFGEVKLDGNDVYWLEVRPRDHGRWVVVRRALAGGKATDLIRSPFSARTRAHEYGGGAWTISEGTLYFSNDEVRPGREADGRLYRIRPHGKAVALVPQGNWRYADGTVDRTRARWLGVREDHTDINAEYPTATIVAVDLTRRNRAPATVLIAGHDFFSSPRLAPNGRALAWLAWDHPNMPWHGTKLYLSELDDDSKPCGTAILVAGSENESIFQPEWLPCGTGICFSSDRTGWWNLYIYDLASRTTRALMPMSAEFGQAQWLFGLSSYGISGANQIVTAYIRNGLGHLGLIDSQSGGLETFELPFTEFNSVQTKGDNAVFLAGAPDRPMSVVLLNLRSRRYEVLKQATDILEDLRIKRYLSTPEPVEFPTSGGATAFGFYYPPVNPDYVAPAGDKPPLRVRCHGGPTSAASTTLSLSIQFWTSRGVAILDVNYGGSTGYGREYRNRLHHNWGVVDVEDTVSGATFLVNRGSVDPGRLVVAGGSAGGYTTLAALTFHNIFQGGASYYGVSDLATLAKDTHKFEARYLDWLIGPYPQAKALYDERSPLRHASRLSRPVIFIQGDEDVVVPPSQTEMIVDALRSHDVTAGYILFSGEQHGIRRGPNIQRALDAELYFYAFMVFGTKLSF
jgi:dipeptidyl aminopeptidase/acylaminoacyl peptidase